MADKPTDKPTDKPAPPSPTFALLKRLEAFDQHSKTHGGAGLVGLLDRLAAQLDGTPALPPTPTPE